MKAMTLRFVLFALVAVSSALASERCLCQAMNLTRCEGTGPVLLNYPLWSRVDRGSRHFDVGPYYQPPHGPWSRGDCRALSYVAVPREVPVFNYYGNLVYGCAVVWTGCDIVDSD